MDVVIDTHALYWYFTGNKSLTKKAKVSLDRAKTIFIPLIVLSELLYLQQKKHALKQFQQIYREIKDNDKFKLLSLDQATFEIALSISDKLELHDRIIVASAKLLNLKLITKDPIIKENFKDIIW